MAKTLRACFGIILSVLLLCSMSMTSFANVIQNTLKDRVGPAMDTLDGASITMLGSSTESQMMGYIIKTKSGKLIVVDGGLEADAPHLKELLKANGGRVSAWLLTHPHSDHVGAIINILNDPNSGIAIEGIYYHLTDLDWYKRNEAYRADLVEQFMQALTKADPNILHGDVKYGDVITVDDAVIHVMNAPYLFTVNAINNSSVAYRVDVGGKRVMFLGDMGEQAGESLLHDVHVSELKSDIVQMAHHGQYGVSKKVYEAISPSVAMWNAPDWLYNNTSGKYLTLEVRKWMADIGVRRNYVAKDGDQTIQ